MVDEVSEDWNHDNNDEEDEQSMVDEVSENWNHDSNAEHDDNTGGENKDPRGTPASCWRNWFYLE